MIKVKICCISNKEEAAMAIQCGANILGLVGKMPSGPGIIKDEEIKDIANAVIPPTETFLLTSEVSAAGIIKHHQQVKTSGIQIVDALPIQEYALIRSALPDIRIVQVIHVLDHSSIEAAINIASMVDAILLDSGNPKEKVKILGGTGKTHNWEISRQIVAQSPKPVFLAGGLNVNNIKQAIASVQPYGVDLCSSVRKNGKLNEELLTEFFKTLKS